MTKPSRYSVVHAHPFKVQIAVFRKFKHLRKEFPKAPTFDRTSNAGCVMWEDDGCMWFAMVLPDGTPVATIAHECVHAADFVMENAGIEAEGNTEIRAYLMEHIMQQVLDGPDE